MEEARRFDGDTAELFSLSGGNVSFCGLTQPASAFLLAETLRRNPKTFLVYAPTPIEAEDFVHNLEFFWPEGADAEAILLLPGYEIKPFGGESPAQDLVFSRLLALSALLSGRRPLVVVASAPGALQRSLPPKALSDASELLEVGEEVDREALIKNMIRSGYYRTSLVQSQGDFSVRGGILDLYPPGAARPVRVEFFGDYIESIRTFRTLDQRSVEDLHEQVVLPASEIIYNGGKEDKVAEALTTLSEESRWLDLLWAPLVDKIRNQQFFPGLESYLPLFYDRLATLRDYAGPDVVHLIIEPERWFEAGLNHLSRIQNRFAVVQAEERPHLALSALFLEPEQVLEDLNDRRQIEIKELAFDGPEALDRPYHFRVETNGDLRALIDTSKAAGLLAPLAARIKTWQSRQLKVALVCHTKEQAGRLAELLEDYGLYATLDLKGRAALSRNDHPFVITVGFLSAGFVMEASARAFVTEEELFGPKRKVVRRAAEEIKGIHLSSFQDLGMGDFVVHNDHGIGQYLGLVKLEVGGLTNDYLHLVYRGGDKLYVPVDRFGAVGKYVGADDRPPSLDKLGGTSWERVKARIKASIREMADELLKLYARRNVSKGHAFSPRDSYFREFEASFEFEETPDQMAAIDLVLEDMAREKPMDRLVCGDVGYGKTEVALRAAFKTVSESKQVAVLVPTTVLAQQHYQTFSQRLNNYPALVEVLSRFKKPAEQREILKRLAGGGVDIIVGTHRLLQRDVAFKDLGLVIIDEEHRFGVAAKEKLKKLRTEVDVLAMSATPIPRTLSMSLSGIRDLSVIETPPQDRLAIRTYLLKYDEPTICEAMARELDRGGQVFFVHNRVKDIEVLAGRFRRLMPMVRFAVAHGQQKERDLEAVMLQFLKREVDVLITTSIIESGLDFPTANTIIINNADRFGLAQIYQLRGRVGRSTQQAYAYLLVASEENLTRDARKRLRALMDLSDLGAGFKIALHDLQIRGAGNMLGSAQSGQIAAVGYEMYIQLMDRAIREQKGDLSEEEIEPELVLGVASYIPESYVPDTEQRLVLYRRLSSIPDPEGLEDIAAELLDRFGPPPLEVENLILAMELKHWLRKARVKKLEMGQSGLTLTFAPKGPPDTEKLISTVKSYPGNAKISPDGKLFFPLDGLDGLKSLKLVKKILQGLMGQNNINNQ